MNIRSWFGDTLSLVRLTLLAITEHRTRTWFLERDHAIEALSGGRSRLGSDHSQLGGPACFGEHPLICLRVTGIPGEAQIVLDTATTCLSRIGTRRHATPFDTSAPERLPLGSRQGLCPNALHYTVAAAERESSRQITVDGRRVTTQEHRYLPECLSFGA